MRFLANENFSIPSVQLLRAAGHEVAAVIEESPGAADIDILARAAREDYIILTFDRDYGQLIFQRRLPSPAGVVYFRLTPLNPAEPAERLLHFMSRRETTFAGLFTVLQRDQVRQRPLPPPPAVAG
jgi:predicted nuclease of predicted toxin-antitoxin system